MAQDNTVTIVGNLTREPELRFTPSGQATANFGVAVNRTWTDRASQERREQTSFFDIVCWGTLAENAATSLSRGMRVVVTGRLDQRSWETQEGDKRSKVEITADEIAPSLRWATVQVTRNERRSPDAANGEAHSSSDPSMYQRPAQEPAPAAYTSRPPAAAYTPGPAGHDDEEPF
ncbi:MAG: single-stranded DNA-binding protein [Actinobacteria bacterium]|nr:single-stranded DNA-binding protein [Actinomycetota bacterium]